MLLILLVMFASAIGAYAVASWKPGPFGIALSVFLAATISAGLSIVLVGDVQSYLLGPGVGAGLAAGIYLR